MGKKKSEERKFVDVNGRGWPTQLGNLRVGSKFVLYGTELCTVKSIDPDNGPGGVVYAWKDKEHHGLPPVCVWTAWCEE